MIKKTEFRVAEFRFQANESEVKIEGRAVPYNNKTMIGD